MDDVVSGDQLIARVYNAIRKSPIWYKSMLIITWDEHGGFYDHVVPPPAWPPGDKEVFSNRVARQPLNVSGFRFNRYGVRVPAVIVSPWIAKNVIDHRLYDHASIPATVETFLVLTP